MHADEFVILLLWVLAPPLLIGLLFLWLLAAGAGSSSIQRFFHAASLLAMLAGLTGALLFVCGPPWLGHYLGIRDVEVFGITTMWAPFAVVSVALAFPFAAWAVRRGVKP